MKVLYSDGSFWLILDCYVASKGEYDCYATKIDF